MVDAERRKNITYRDTEIYKPAVSYTDKPAVSYTDSH
jgi:hypothetical protein|nr:MAG: hypothetical protein [Bacteriophage sp.]